MGLQAGLRSDHPVQLRTHIGHSAGNDDPAGISVKADPSFTLGSSAANSAPGSASVEPSTADGGRGCFCSLFAASTWLAFGSGGWRIDSEGPISAHGPRNTEAGRQCGPWRRWHRHFAWTVRCPLRPSLVLLRVTARRLLKRGGGLKPASERAYRAR